MSELFTLTKDLRGERRRGKLGEEGEEGGETRMEEEGKEG